MISIIIPVYNTEKYVGNCLNSILNQGYQDFEIVCIDDASDDNSPQILAEYAAKDPRIRVFTLSGNKGPNHGHKGAARARNVGLDNSTGEYILFMDSDDELEKDALENMYKGLQEGNAEAAVGQIEVLYNEHEEMKMDDDRYFTMPYSGLVKVTNDVISNFHLCVWGVLYKRDVVDRMQLRFPENFNYEDNFWHWCYFSSVSCINFIDAKVYKYFRRPKSTMSDMFAHGENSIDNLYTAENILDFWQEHNMLAGNLPTAAKIIESMFYGAVKNAPRYKKSLIAYEGYRILTKFNIDTTGNLVLDNIKNGRLAFLYLTDDEENNKNDIVYFKLIKLFNKFFKENTLRYKIICSIFNKLYFLTIKK